MFVTEILLYNHKVVSVIEHVLLTGKEAEFFPFPPGGGTGDKFPAGLNIYVAIHISWVSFNCACTLNS